MTAWTMTLVVLGVLSLMVGFAWRMGYEFSKLRELLSKARYVSFGGYQISIEKGFVKLDCALAAGSFSLSASYPSVQTFYPLVVIFTEVSVSITDESETRISHDYSNYRLDLPSFNPWLHKFMRVFVSFMEPAVKFAMVEYSYKSSSVSLMNVKFSKCCFDVSQSRFVFEGGVVVRGSFGSGFGSSTDSVSLQTDRVECRFNPQSFEIDMASETVEVTYSVYDSVETFFERFSNYMEPIHPIPSSSRLRVTSRIQSSLKFIVESVPSNSSLELVVSMNGSLSKKLRGIYTTVVFDPFSTSIHSFSVHNFNDTRNNRTLSSLSVTSTLFVHNVPVVHMCGSNMNCIIDSGAGGDLWNCSTRLGSIGVALLSSDPTSHRLFHLKQVALVGSSAKGLSLSISSVELDASPRMISRLVRVYTKISSLVFERSANSPGPSREMTNSASSPAASGIVFTPFTVSDLNYVWIQKKFASSSPPSAVATCVTPGMRRSDSASTGLNDSTMSHSRDSKNWRYMERISSAGPDSDQGGNTSRTFFSLVAGSIRVDSGTSKDLYAEVNTVKLVMKTSSIGTKFTSFNCDSICVNDNIRSDGGGFRIWIDGDLLSDQSRVFCLVPPVSIRFDPKFAGIVERYFLDVAEALKGMSKSSPTTARKMIEVLQVSSLKLELHAKEMLGVLSLDKAVINLNKSSVYKSHGFFDAVNSLATQYKADVTSQWLSLLMRLDVSIGRPMTTARKLIGTISGLFVNGNEDVNEK